MASAGRTIVAPDPTFDALPRTSYQKHGITMDKEVPLTLRPMDTTSQPE